MSINRLTTVWCDGDEGHCCCQWVADSSTERELRKFLRRDDWTHKNKLDFCPRCSKNEAYKQEGEDAKARVKLRAKHDKNAIVDAILESKGIVKGDK